MNQKDGSNSEWGNMETLEKKGPIVLMAIWKSVEGGAEAALVARILDSERGV